MKIVTIGAQHIEILAEGLMCKIRCGEKNESKSRKMEKGTVERRGRVGQWATEGDPLTHNIIKQSQKLIRLNS